VAERPEPLATTSLVLGLACPFLIVLFFVTPVVGLVLWLAVSVAAIVTGALAMKAVNRSGGAKSGRAAATAGYVIGVVSFFVCLIPTVFVIFIAFA
jgi:hypothetical protein